MIVRYAAYTYDWDQDVIKIDYGTNVKGDVLVKVLKLRSEHISEVTIDGHPVEFETETIGQDTYTVFTAPTDEHHLEIIKGQPLAQTVSVEVPSSAAQDTSPKLTSPTLNPDEAAPLPEPESKSSTPVSVLSPGVQKSAGAGPNVASNLVAGPEKDAPSTRPSEAGSDSTKETVGELSEQANEAQTSTLAATESIAARNARETRLAILRFISAGLITLTCLALMLLVVIRRMAGLSYQQSSAIHHRSSAQKMGTIKRDVPDSHPPDFLR